VNVQRDPETGKVFCPKCKGLGFKPNKQVNKKRMTCIHCGYKAELPSIDMK
jgi:DNA-directed RNA polymerase subunit M/transcription elongation factor TFIIS